MELRFLNKEKEVIPFPLPVDTDGGSMRDESLPVLMQDSGKMTLPEEINGSMETQDGDEDPVDNSLGEFDQDNVDPGENEPGESNEEIDVDYQMEQIPGMMREDKLVEDASGEDDSIDPEKSLPEDKKGDPNKSLEDLYNDLDIQEGDYVLDVIVDHHFKDGILILKA
eukprot:398949-Ditylum_brightwellii.AAC.1